MQTLPVMLAAGQMILAGFRGTEAPNAELRHLICEVKVGGVMLFAKDLPSQSPTRNIESAGQLAKLNAGIRELARECGAPVPLISADVEGGYVNRLQKRFGFEPILSHEELGALGTDRTLEEATRAGKLLASVGIDWNLAPVVDLAIDPEGEIVAKWDRAFSDKPEVVAAHARAFIDGMDRSGVRNALKHFPGLGSSRADPHHDFVDLTDTARREAELEPYRLLIASGVVDSVVTAHALDRNIDPRLPATLSKAALTGLLRGKLGFKGVIVADDLQMDAVADHYKLEEAVVLAVQAGADMLMISNNRTAYDADAPKRAVAALVAAVKDGRLSEERLRQSAERIAALRRGRKS